MPSLSTLSKLMCAVEPSSRACKSWRKPLLMASATISEATPAATPRMEIAGDNADERLAAFGAKVAGRDEEFEAHEGRLSAVSFQPKRIIAGAVSHTRGSGKFERSPQRLKAPS